MIDDNAPDMLAWALAYAARGWAVFPCHSIRAGACSCPAGHACGRPGKHPRTQHGRNDASTDAEQVRKWWTRYPDANIGVATGRESGLVVVDEDVLGALPQPLPRTLCARTGGGGLHHYYIYPPDGVAHQSSTNVLAKGVDSRADGGYVIAPPSLHASGSRYEWLPGQAPGECQCASAPEWWLAAIRRDVPTGPQAVPSWTPDGTLPDNLEGMLRAIPADDYQTWRDVGLALSHADPEGGLAWWDWWSSTAGNYDASAVQHQWRCMVRKGHRVANPITIATIERLAREHGYVDPMVEQGARIAEVLIAADLRKRSEALVQQVEAICEPEVEQAPDIMPAAGLIREIACWILDASMWPQPALAVAASMTFVGTIIARRWRTITDARTNLYTIGIGKSGGGKDQARQCLSKLAAAAGASGYLGGEEIASGPGLFTALVRHPAQMFQIDEFGLALATMTGAKADPGKKQLMAALMKFYSSANRIVNGSERANQKDNPRVDLDQPSVSIYGTTTPVQFYGALTSTQGLDGTLARMTCIFAPDEDPPRQLPNIDPPPESLVRQIREIVTAPFPGGNLAGLACCPTTVPSAPGVHEAWERFDDMCRARDKGDGIGALWTRAGLTAYKLALIHAVSMQRDAIEADSLAWGAEIALWSTSRLAREVQCRVADNETEREHQKVAAIIRAAGRKGITKTALSRQCMSVGARLDAILSFLDQSGMLLVVRGASGPQGGRPTTTYYIVAGQ